MAQTDQTKQWIRENLGKQGPIFGAIAAVGGFIGDVLEPLAPFVSYIFFTSAITSLALFLTLLFAKILRQKLASAFVFSLATLLVSGVLYGLQGDDKINGIVSSRVPAIESLQKSLGIFQEDIKNIKAQADRIEKKTDQVLVSLERINENFSYLQKQGGIISNPEKPEEVYHNARIYELSGDYSKARRSYIRYIGFDLNYMDPHVNFQTFLKVQEGLAGARETYRYLSRDKQSQAMELAQIILLEGQSRRVKLKTFMANNPNFLPAIYEMAKEFSEQRLGQQSLADKQQEKTLLQEFLKRCQGGTLLKFYLDQKYAAELLTDTATRLKKLKMISDTPVNPVVIDWMKNNSNWMGNISIAETTLEIFYRHDAGGDFKSTGFINYINPETGRKQPKNQIQLPLSTKTALIEIQYRDINNHIRGPYANPFDVVEATINSAKRYLTSSTGFWVGFRFDKDGQKEANFSHLHFHLHFHKEGVKAITYGINQETPDMEYDFSNRDYDDDRIKLSPSFKYMVVQVKFSDGSLSDIQRFDWKPSY